MEISSNVITVIDIGIGNISSVGNALKQLDIPFRMTDRPADIAQAEKLIFPGVGTFAEASQRISTQGIREVLRKKVLEDHIPILGICLGMQLLASTGDEGGRCEGLDLIKAHVSLMRPSSPALPLPHIGWNDVHFDGFKCFNAIQNGACFYFVHSYEMIVAEPVIKAVSEYGVQFVAAVQKDHIVGTQFHPEKSQKAGLTLLNNFCRDFYCA